MERAPLDSIAPRVPALIASHTCTLAVVSPWSPRAEEAKMLLAKEKEKDRWMRRLRMLRLRMGHHLNVAESRAVPRTVWEP